MDSRILALALVLLVSVVSVPGSNAYKIGVGRADCTGPPVEVVFMGYAQILQKGEGIHLRQFSRAFIVEDEAGKRMVFVSFDAAMIGNAVKRAVIGKLKDRYGDLYRFENVIMSGTHTHSAPGGFMTHLLYDLSTLGFVQQTFDAYVSGIYNSIVRAHENMIDGRLYYAQTEILNANINRSPNAYQNNPQSEKDKYEYDVDKTLTQIRFVSSATGKPIGVINWFPVHPTSMNNTNRLVSSDNVGYASVLLEQEYNPEDLIGKGDFVGAFASTNLGDVSPNIMGPKCEFTGNPCDLLTSSCPKSDGQCIASGPGANMFESTKIIATRIYKGASKLLRESPAWEITGPIKFIHQYINMPLVNTSHLDPSTNHLEGYSGCLPAMGYSFGAGTTDGPGAFDFRQGTTSDNPVWNMIRNFIAEPTKEDEACQAPKPILVPTGRATIPYEWQPKIVSTHLLMIGNVILAGVPGEFTTMSGRRLKDSVRNSAFRASNQDFTVILCGLSNMYTSYITTPEEYEVQRYEGASTIFGPHTLTIYLDQYAKLTEALVTNQHLDEGPMPPKLEDGSLLILQTGVIYDGHPFASFFGDVRTQPASSYSCGQTMKAKFTTANPRNNILHEKSYFTVERQDRNGDFHVVATDANWDTRFYWTRTSIIFGHSETVFVWDIPTTCTPGTYRVQHYGNARYLFGGVKPYKGTTKTFTVTAP